MQSRWRSLMISQGMGSRKGKDLWKDSTCSSFLEQGRDDKGRSEVGRERRRGESRESRYRKVQSRWRSLMISQGMGCSCAFI